MNGGPSGFNNAPVTRTTVIATVLFTIIFGIQGRHRDLAWSYQDILKKLQIWKLIVSVFGFSSTPELVFGIYLLYYFRVFERQIGSNKYSVFVLFSTIVSLIVEVIAQWLLKAGLQLLLSSWKRSMLPGICGILAGSLYRSNVFHTHRMKLPDFVASFFSRLSWPSIGNTSPTVSPRNVLGSAPSSAVNQMQGSYPAPAPMSSMLEPPEDSIATLVSMGFERNSARQALMHARNDINAATNILLDPHTS